MVLKQRDLPAAIMNPNIAPCTKVKLRNSIDKKAIVNPSNVAGIILNKMAGLPICFIWFILIPNPPINNTVTKLYSLMLKIYPK